MGSPGAKRTERPQVPQVARALVACSLEATDVCTFFLRRARAPFQAFTPVFTPYLVSVVRVP
jgi:hypothetical protein